MLRGRGGELAAIILLAVALAYLAAKSVFSYDGPSEFPMFWGVGRALASGISPYSTEMARAIWKVPPDMVPPWFYPPQWSAILWPLGLLPMDQAIQVWRAANALLLFIAALALGQALPRAGVMLPKWAPASFVLFAALVQATPATLSMGQSSILIFAGYCLWARGLILSERVTLALGLMLLFLKPHFGVPAGLALLLLPSCWGALLIAAAGTLAAALPQFLMHGTESTLRDLVGNIAAYGSFRPNAPIYANGLSHLCSRFLGINLSGLTLALLCGATSMAATLILRQRRNGNAAVAFTVIALAMFLIPTHPYGIVAFAPLAILAMAFDWPVRACAWLSMAICLRPRLVWDALSLPGLRPNGDATPQNIPLTALILTVASVLALVSAGLVLRRQPGSS